MQLLKINHPIGCGALYQFRDHKKLGLPLGPGLTDNDLRLNDVRAVFPVSVCSLSQDDTELKLIFKRGYKNHLLLDKFISKGSVVAFAEGQTLWTVKHITFLTYNPYREVILSYLGLVDHSDE